MAHQVSPAVMTQFPDSIIFRYSWRTYQERLLNELDDHLRNKHLHLVAPPGSGKTVIGLEVMLRVNKPTIIIAPTLTIKYQWADRFKELFLQTGELPDWISTNIRKPAFVTITTYQALNHMYRTIEKATARKEGPEDKNEEMASQSEAKAVKTKLDEMAFQTIILDEAHHLRTEWWRTTLKFRERLEEPTVVALTATPPYDVLQSEWDKYIQLCGQIDAEISVPELVREQDLCPHQDFIYMSELNEKEAEPFMQFRQDIRKFRTSLLENKVFKTMIETHPWIRQQEQYTEEILGNPSYFSSMLIFLKETESNKWKEGAKLLGLKGEKVPVLSDEWLEEILQGVLFHDDYVEREHPELKDILKALRKIGAIERRKVHLQSSPELGKALVQSASKLDSIQDIAVFEEQVMGENLRMVILTDYIRKDSFPAPGEEKQQNRLGVVPIFEKIRSNLKVDVPVGILTGSLVVLPAAAIPMLQEEAEQRGVNLSWEPLPHDETYVEVTIRQSNRSAMVAMVTAVFAEGGVHVLVGTAALLGEGWDAPHINSLIMASYVGSFMLSNQMRGRAIRTEKGNPDKTAAIWHLACVEKKEENGGHDLNSLRRRFRSLIGLSFKTNSIETGIERMGITASDKFDDDYVNINNGVMLEQAGKRSELYNRWMESVTVHGGVTEELKTSGEQIPKPFIMENTIRFLITLALLTSLLTMIEAVSSPQFIISDAPWWLKLGMVVLISAVASFKFTFKALRLSLKHRSLEDNLHEVGDTVYKTLYDTGYVKPEPTEHRIKTEEVVKGVAACWVEGGSTYEKHLYLDALQQLLGPVENPRYLIYRKEKSWFLPKKEDFHPVPDEIGKRKEYAEILLKNWHKKIGPAQLIYTRTPDGRKLLLNARIKAMANKFTDKSERLSVWR